jgi:hypothetical protein
VRVNRNGLKGENCWIYGMVCDVLISGEIPGDSI